MPLRMAVCQVQEVDESIASFARQLGVTSINITTAAIPATNGYWEVDDLVDLKRRCEELGLTLEVIENLPYGTYEKIILGREGRDQQIENYCRSIRNMASAEIPILGFHFMPNGVWRTSMTAPSRGGSTATAYDHSLASQGNKVMYPADVIQPSVQAGDPGLSSEELWSNYQYFLDGVLPTADEVGMKLAQHPDDPPVDKINGFARVFNSPAAYKRALEMAKGSPAWGINLCIGTVSEMYGAESVHEMIEFFGPLDRIRYVHFRDVAGSVPNFVETWLGEGNFIPHKVVEHLLAVGFSGWLQDDHVPFMTEDTPYGHRARAHEIGYLQGILSTMKGH